MLVRQAQKSQDELKAELEQRELKVLMSKNTSKASSQAPSGPPCCFVDESLADDQQRWETARMRKLRPLRM